MYEYDKDELKQMADEAKKKINDGEDIYAGMRDDNEVINTSTNTRKEEQHPKLSREVKPQEYENFDYKQDSLPNLDDAPIFENGPLQSQIELWKKQYPDSSIVAIELVDQKFVFRTIERTEYKALLALDKIDQLQREEIICETVTLFPYDYTWEVMARQKGGIPSTYSTIIMEHSGFTQNYGVQIL